MLTITGGLTFGGLIFTPETTTPPIPPGPGGEFSNSNVSVELPLTITGTSNAVFMGNSLTSILPINIVSTGDNSVFMNTTPVDMPLGFAGESNRFAKTSTLTLLPITLSGVSSAQSSKIFFASDSSPVLPITLDNSYTSNRFSSSNTTALLPVTLSR